MRETLRLVMNGSALRRNLVDDLQVDGKCINKGVFVAYNLGDVHLDGGIYKEPLMFDPERFCVPREEDKNGELLFLAWGAGRHPCHGQFYLHSLISLSYLFFFRPHRHESGKAPSEIDDSPFPSSLRLRSCRRCWPTVHKAAAAE